MLCLPLALLVAPMTRTDKAAVVLALAVAILGAAFVLVVLASQPTSINKADPWPRTSITDIPLLTDEQRTAAAKGETVAFYAAGKHYVVAGMPQEYIFKE